VKPVIFDDRVSFPFFEPKIPWNPCIVLIGFTVTTAPVVKFAGADAEPLNKLTDGYVRFTAPYVNKINNPITGVVGNPICT